MGCDLHLVHVILGEFSIVITLPQGTGLAVSQRCVQDPTLEETRMKWRRNVIVFNLTL
jgi:hypothetical protein